MNELVGPLSQGRIVLVLSVVVGSVLVGGVLFLARLAGFEVPADVAPYAAVAAIVVGLAVVFLSYAGWHYYRRT